MRRIAVMLLLLLAAAAAANAADPPEILNYQGVLRNASDVPLDGVHEMEFVFYSAEAGGDQILADLHTVADSQPVTVTGGLFNVSLGGGKVVDGVGPGFYDTPSAMFRDYGGVWMAIKVGAETLTPRVRIASSAYALNSAYLGGRKAGEYLDTSATTQVKSGSLTVNDLSSSSGYLYFGPGGQILGNSGYMELKGNEDTDALYLKGGNSAADGQIAIFGQGRINLRAGTGEFAFTRGNTGQEIGNLSGVGDLQIDGGLNADGQHSYFGTNVTLYSGASLTSLYNNDDTDAFRIVGGDSNDDGMIEILGDSDIVLQSGNGRFVFRYGATGGETASLSSSGNLQIDGGLNADGSYSYFGDSATLVSSATVTALYNDAHTDYLRVVGGADLYSSHIELNGSNEIELRAANGNFEFFDIGSGLQVAGIDNFGDLQLDGYLDDDGSIDVISGTTVNVAGSPALMDFAGVNLILSLGDSAADSVTVPGNLTVSGTKNFIQNHPYRADLTVHYTALEGGESATYTRGSARLVDGQTVVPLDESFAWVTHPELGLTAHVTPRGQAASLWVESVTTSELTVRCDEPYCADAAFDYIVTGLRIGYEEFPVVQPRVVEAPVPPPGYFASRRATDLRSEGGSPRERFARERQEVFALEPIQGGRAQVLREAIGVHPYDEPVPVGSRRATEVDGARPRGVGGDPSKVDRPSVDPGSGDGGAPATPGAGQLIGPALIGPSNSLNTRSLRASRPSLATTVRVSGPVEAGTLLALDPETPGVLRVADAESGVGVFGVVVEEPGVLLGSREDAEVSVALAGVTLCRVDAGYGAILPGDLLVASPTPGYAMRAVDPQPGSVIGKALEPLDVGTGTVEMLVMMR